MHVNIWRTCVNEWPYYTSQWNVIKTKKNNDNDDDDNKDDDDDYWYEWPAIDKLIVERIAWHPLHNVALGLFVRQWDGRH